MHGTPSSMISLFHDVARDWSTPRDFSSHKEDRCSDVVLNVTNRGSVEGELSPSFIPSERYRPLHRDSEVVKLSFIALNFIWETFLCQYCNIAAYWLANIFISSVLNLEKAHFRYKPKPSYFLGAYFSRFGSLDLFKIHDYMANRRSPSLRHSTAIQRPSTS